MGISVEEFITEQEEKGRRSKLEPFKTDILLLKQKGFSQKQIQQFLMENGLKVGLTTINWFIKTRSKLETIHKPVNSKVEVQKAPQLQNHLQKNESQIPANGSSETAGKGKFNWQSNIDPEAYK
ncbi:hypothetical protein HMPREF3050_09145 [Neisseria sp. HMSC065D04]|jgi:hypothetical protein|uniref:hypothetical protein n=1 Tax=Neisseria sp. HMSC065D04 TaxID=1739542 RepID=UPI0008A138E9|nr:hypothetical protein [Neisseria sp. HMSC065D04]OFO29645.1 hypothetical protein HMPREF3050_09145 [Neisseria sp. HMSC065D04]